MSRINELLKKINLLTENDITQDVRISSNKSVEYFKTETGRTIGDSLKYSSFIDERYNVLHFNLLEEKAIPYFNKAIPPNNYLIIKLSMELLNDEGGVPDKFKLTGFVYGLDGVKFKDIEDMSPLEVTKKLVDWLSKNKNIIISVLDKE